MATYGIVGGPSIDPEPDNLVKPYNERIRCNRFASRHWDQKLCELLTEGEFNPAKPYENLAIPIKGIIRYWWNNLADQEGIIEEAFEAVLTVYKDRLLPGKEEGEQTDYSEAFSEILKSIKQLHASFVLFAVVGFHKLLILTHCYL